MLKTRSERITLEMTQIEAVMAVAEGNPGALHVCMDALKEGEKIDPDAAFGGMSVLFDFDTMGVYGSQIWVLFKNCCGSSLVNMFAVLRACQLGELAGIKRETIKSAIAAETKLDCEAALKAVRDRLLGFAAA